MSSSKQRLRMTALMQQGSCALFAVLLLIGASISQDTDVSPVVIDTDGGPDDAVGILLFLWNEANSFIESNEPFKLQAVTTVSGNTGVHNATRNVQVTLELAGRLDIPVYAGSSKGLMGLQAPDYFFGDDGFGDFLTPALENANVENEAVDQLVKFSRKHHGSLSLICLGPLTNIALAQRKDPLFLHRIKKIYMMGGTVMGYGNIKPGVEFNVYQDPEAVDVVFRESPSVITVMPFDPVFLNPIKEKWRQHVFGRLNSSRVQFLNKAERKALPKLKFWSSPDAQAVATAIWPNLITKNITVPTVVETGGVHARGALLIKHPLYGVQSNNSNVNFVQEINVNDYKQILLLAFKD